MKRSFILGVLAAISGGLTYSIVPGCASPFVNEKVGPQAAKAITAYCLQPESVRLVTRQEVNRLISPNEVRIACVGDVGGQLPRPEGE